MNGSEEFKSVFQKRRAQRNQTLRCLYFFSSKICGKERYDMPFRFVFFFGFEFREEWKFLKYVLFLFFLVRIICYTKPIWISLVLWWKSQPIAVFAFLAMLNEPSLILKLFPKLNKSILLGLQKFKIINAWCWCALRFMNTLKTSYLLGVMIKKTFALL